jgi:anti-anti-sigma factor
MDAPQCTLRFRQDDGTLTVQIEGRGTMRQAPGLRRLAECGQMAGVRQFVLDLQPCSFMDSTFLGTLLCLRRQLGEDRLLLARPSLDCRRGLEQIGLLDIFHICAELPVPDKDWITTPDTGEDLSSFRTSVVQAHQALAGLPGGSGERFRSVAACLSAESAARK